jgi:hypothetical protein
MNRLLKLSLAALAASPLLASTVAADEPAKKPQAAAAAKEAPPADITGVWELRMTIPGRPTQDSTLKIEKDGDKYAGFLTNSQGRFAGQGRPTPVKDLQYKDGEMSFKMVFERGGQKTELVYAAKVNGENMTGNVTITGRSFKLTLAGRRESPVEGVWKMTFVLDSGEKLQPSIQVKYAKDKFTGEYVGISGKKASIAEVKLKDGEVSFDAPDHGDEDVLFHYKGKLADDKIKGTVSWKVAGNQTRSLKFEGEKSHVHAAEVAGTWKLKVPMKNETFESTLTLTQTGSSVSGTYVGESGETKITDGLVLGDEFSFDVARERDGKSYKLRYQGKINGELFKGSVDYNFDGMTGNVEFEGKRVAPATPAKP